MFSGVVSSKSLCLIEQGKWMDMAREDITNEPRADKGATTAQTVKRRDVLYIRSDQ